ncbi:MAG: hypothetical protein FJ202_12400 [Gemmatimonadetes bacterium]|nr:hypothetical protein [Gemmatimonadota bacterium]
MTTGKDLKRLVRARMAKTGESYTTARMHLLHAKPAKPQRRGAGTAPPKRDFEALSGIRNSTLAAATGCAWEKWMKSLDYYSANAKNRRALAAVIVTKYRTSPWWASRLAAGYERIVQTPG